jgi:uncharacterized protein YjdB
MVADDLLRDRDQQTEASLKALTKLVQSLDQREPTTADYKRTLTSLVTSYAEVKKRSGRPQNELVAELERIHRETVSQINLIRGTSKSAVTPSPTEFTPQSGGSAFSPSPVPASKSPPLTILTYSGGTHLLAGSTERFKAEITLPNGSTKDVTGEVKWDASDRGISINSRGDTDVKAAPGPVTITATHAATGATGSITVTVVTRILRKIIISPKDPLVEVDTTQILKAIGEFSDHTTEDVTEGFGLIWESRNEKAAKVTSFGHCDTHAPGKAAIWAYDPNTAVIDAITVTVSAQGKAPKLVKLHVTPIDPTVTDFAPLQFTAMGDYADKSSHEVTERVRWVSTKPDTLAIRQGSGLATPGLVADIAWVTAVDDATKVYARSEVTVNVPRLTSIEIAPRDPSLPAGDTVPVTVMGTFSDRTTKDVTDKVIWSTTNQTVAAVVPVLIQIFGRSEGTADIGAAVPSFPDVGDFISVTVLPAVVTLIEIAPGNTTLQVNGKRMFAAAAVFSDGRREALTGRAVRWSSDDEKIAIIDQKGEVTAKGPGTATITATHPASRRSEFIVVTVEPPKLTEMRVSPDKPSVKVNGTVQLKAAAKFSDDHTEDQTASAYWASDREDIATVDASGKVTGKAPGRASISATSDGVPGAVDAEVTP